MKTVGIKPGYKYYKSQLYKTDTIIKNQMICVRERKSMC